ncbi:MAG: lysylphosphatidylglycerol synthase transmembrane domain-containing protein [Candidatus Diapherotrites archaeon]
MKKILYYLAGLIFFILFVSQFNIDFSIFLSVQKPEFILLAFICLFVSLIFQSLRLKALLLSFTSEKTKFSDLFKLELINRFFLYVLPARLNLLAKAGIISRNYKLTKTDSVAITTFEQVIDFWMILIPAAIGLIFFISLFNSLPVPIILAFFALMFVVSIGFFMVPQGLFEVFILKSEKIKISFLSRIIIFLLKFARDMRVNWIKLIKSTHFGTVFIYTILYWSASLLSFYFLFFAVNSSVDLIPLAISISFALFAGVLSTIPGGLGVRESAVILVLGFFAVSYDVSFFVVVVNRLLVCVFLFFGYFLLLKRGYSTLEEIKRKFLN